MSNSVQGKIDLWLLSVSFCFSIFRQFVSPLQRCKTTMIRYKNLLIWTTFANIVCAWWWCYRLMMMLQTSEHARDQGNTHQAVFKYIQKLILWKRYFLRGSFISLMMTAQSWFLFCHSHKINQYFMHSIGRIAATSTQQCCHCLYVDLTKWNLIYEIKE